MIYLETQSCNMDRLRFKEWSVLLASVKSDSSSLFRTSEVTILLLSL